MEITDVKARYHTLREKLHKFFTYNELSKTVSSQSKLMNFNHLLYFSLDFHGISDIYDIITLGFFLFLPALLLSLLGQLYFMRPPFEVPCTSEIAGLTARSTLLASRYGVVSGTV